MPSRLTSVYLLFPVLLEVLLPLHCSASPSLVVGRQKHVAHVAEGQAHKSSGAADGAPDPPVNLRVFPTSDTIVQLIWDPPSDTTDVDHYYVYVEGEDMDGITTAPVYIFTNLVACTNYTFGVQSVTAADIMSDPLLGDGTTDVGVPPPPRNLQVDDYTATTVTLSWEEPGTLCDVEEYRVKWSDDGIDTQSSKVTETFFTVTDLSKNTTYTFDVSGLTSAGEGDAATVQQTTAVDDGGPPEDLVAEGLSTSVISVSWSPPLYEPEYYVVVVLGCKFLNEIVVGLSYNITGLNPCDPCDVKVTSYYSETTQYSANVLGSSLSGDPPPPTGCSVTAAEDIVTVTWNRPITDCDLGNYSLNYTWTKQWGDGGEGSGGKITTATEFTVLYPVSYSTYSFKISSSIDGVFGIPASCNGTSLETLPGAPVILNVDSEEGKVLVTWKAPLEENGVIVNYEIYVDGKSEDMVQGDVFSASVNLEPCKSVGLSVRALNGAGWGPLSDVETETVVDDVLPKTVNCAVSDLQVEVCWEPYSPTCPVSQYNLEWEGDVLWDEDLVDSNSTTMEWSASTTCYNVSALPYTEYYVELSVGIKPDTISCSDITPMAVSSPPTDLRQIDNDTSSVTVQWDLPVYIRGKLTGWHLTWTTVDDTRIGESNITETEDMTYKINDLSSSSTYVVYVMALNGAGESPPANVSAKTMYVPPSKSNTGLIIGLSVGGGILLIILLVGGFILYRKQRSAKPPRSAPHMPEVTDADSHGEFGRRPSQQIDIGRPNLREYGRRPSQQAGLGRPNLSEYGRRSSQQVELGRPNLGEYGRRPSQQVDLGRPNLSEYGRRPSQQADLGRPNLSEYGRRPSQQADLGKPRLGEYGRRPSQQVDLGRPRLAEYGRRASQQVDLGRTVSSEYARRPSQQLPSGSGSYPARLPHEGVPRRSSVDLHSRRSSQQTDIGRPGDRMFMKRPSQQFVMKFDEIQEL